MKDQCHPRHGLRQNYSVIVSYLQVTDVIKDKERNYSSLFQWFCLVFLAHLSIFLKLS